MTDKTKDFIQKLKGDYDDLLEIRGWTNSGKYKKIAQAQLNQLWNDINTNAYTDNNCILRWNDTGKCVEEEKCEILFYTNYPFNYHSTKLAREKEEKEEELSKISIGSSDKIEFAEPEKSVNAKKSSKKKTKR